MNRKLIATAVSAIVAAPMAANAEISLYGRVNNAIDINDLSDDSNSDVSGVASRFGLRGSTELGNGLTVHGRYEFSTASDNEGSGVGDTRIATAGVSGSFGRVDIGNQWSSYFNTFGTLVSPTFTLGYYIYSSIGGAPYRASNTIKYSNTFGPVSLQLDVRLNDSDEDSDDAEKIRGNGVGLGLSFAVTDNITIAAAFDSEDGDGRDAVDAVSEIRVDDVDGEEQVIREAVDAQPADDAPDTDRFGIGIKANFGSFWGSLGWQSYEVDAGDRDGDDEVDTDTTILYVGGDFSSKTNWLVGYSEADDGTDDDPNQVTWGVYHNVGGGLRLYYEATNVDSGDNDGARHLFGMRVDF